MASEQLKKPEAAEQEEKVELPLQSSPYVKYSDLEDYKMAAYGAMGHVDPADMPQDAGGGGTDGPTLSGSGLSETQAKAIDIIASIGMP